MGPYDRDNYNRVRSLLTTSKCKVQEVQALVSGVESVLQSRD